MNKYVIVIQTGERVSVAVKTCKDYTADVKEKFMSEAGKAFFILMLWRKLHNKYILFECTNYV